MVKTFCNFEWLIIHILLKFVGMVADPRHNNKKCGPEGSSKRVFKLNGKRATEANCKKVCMKEGECVAMSGRWNKWCVGCKVELDEPTVNPYDRNAIAFKKIGMIFPTPLILILL